MGARGSRYRRIFTVLARYGFHDVVAGLSGNRLTRFLFSRKSQTPKSRDRWVRLRHVLEELGPAWVKFGQILSNRPGLLPDELTEELAKLQDSVTPFSTEEAFGVISETFGRDVTELFRDFDPVPLASASIAQVHLATLHTGEKVAVKIQRPGIEAIIRADLLLMRDLARLMSRSAEFSALRPRQLVDVFEKSILEELDFVAEQKHLAWFARKFADDKNIRIPSVYEHLSNAKVITMEYLEGIKISQTQQLAAAGYDLKLIALRGFEAYFKQIFEWGYFHADPHPGNLLIMPGNVVGIIDFGMVGRLQQRDRMALTEFIIGLGRDDTGRIVENIERLQDKDVDNRRELEKDIARFIEDFGSKAVSDINLNEALGRGRKLIFKHNLELNPDLYLMIRSVSLLEGIGMTLDPGFRSLDMIKPYALQLLRKSLNPLKFAKSRQLISWLADMGQLALTLPADTRRILDKLRNDQLRIQTESKSTRLLAREVQKAGKRISYAILFAGFLGAAVYIDHRWYSVAFYTGAVIALIAMVNIRKH